MNELMYYDLKETNGVTLSLSTQVCRELGRRIVGGHIAEGEVIEDENALAARFRVSKTVIRDAVKLLVNKGLLDVRRGSGTRVRSRQFWALLDDDVLAWHLSSDPKPSFLRQLMGIRCMMEPTVAAWAAQSGTEEQFQVIKDAHHKVEHDCHTLEEFVLADALFHRAILRAANNEILQSMEGVIFSALLNSIRLTNTAARKKKQSIPLHDEIVEAIFAGDAVLAKQKMTLHLERANLRLENALKDGAERTADTPTSKEIRNE